MSSEETFWDDTFSHLPALTAASLHVHVIPECTLFQSARYSRVHVLTPQTDAPFRRKTIENVYHVLQRHITT